MAVIILDYLCTTTLRVMVNISFLMVQSTKEIGITQRDKVWVKLPYLTGLSIKGTGKMIR